MQATAGLPLEVCRQVPLIHLSDAMAGLEPRTTDPKTEILAGKS